MTMTSQFTGMTSSLNFFDVVMFLLLSLVTGPNFMSISSLVLKSWQFSISEIYQKSRNLKYSRLNFANIWRLRKVRVTNFHMIASDKKLLNAAKCQGRSFYCFFVIMGKLTRMGGGGGGGIKLPHPLPTHAPRLEFMNVIWWINVNICFNFWSNPDNFFCQAVKLLITF